MSNKNTTGSLVHRTKERIDRLVGEIDRRTKTGEDRENVDHVYQNHSVNKDGERCWSF
jgi:hypothetical protein